MESNEASAIVMSRPSSTYERPSTGGGLSDNYMSSRNSPTRVTNSAQNIKLQEFLEDMSDFAASGTHYVAEVQKAKLEKLRVERNKTESPKVVDEMKLEWKARMSQISPPQNDQDDYSDDVERLQSRSSLNTPISTPTTPVPQNQQVSRELEQSATPDEEEEEEEEEEEDVQAGEENREEIDREEEDQESYATPSRGDENISQTSPRRLEITLTPRSIEPQEVEDNEEDEVEQGQQQEQNRDVEVEEVEEVDEENLRRVESTSSVKTRARSKRRRTTGAASKTRRKSSSVRPALHQQQENLQQQQVVQTTKGKRKKLHGRLRNSNSKSTVTTRDTSFSETRRAERKRPKRNKSLDAISMLRGSQSRKRASGSSLRARESKQITSKDIYEIYHNSASKRESALLQASIDGSRMSGATAGVTAMTSAARSSPKNASAAMSYRARRAARAAAKAMQEDRNTRESTDIVVELNDRGCDDEEEEEMQTLGVGAPAERFEEGDNVEMDDSLKHRANCCELHENENCEDPEVIQVYEGGETTEETGDTTQQAKRDPSRYDQPTESSRMKQVERPYRFHVSHIPFVVGTSLSPSHNLGLNIQQVLSLIKVKQPAIPSINPMLIRKVSKGISPLSSLFEYINGQYGPRPSRCSVNFPIGVEGEHQVRNSSLDVRRAFSSFSCTDQARSTPKSVPSTTNQSSFKQNLQNISCEPLYEEDEESVYSDAQTGLQGASQVKSIETNSKWDSRSFVSNRHSRDSQRTKVQTTGDAQETTPQPCDNPENHEQFLGVFSRLYDQYGRMIAKLDKIKEQLESKRNDKILQREAAEIQDAVEAKGQEVAAMVKLYKEVMSLKQQMRQLHERNSFVCIAADDGIPSRPFYSDSRQVWSQPRNRGISDAPNALRLAGFLKQIQAFQRELALV